MSTDGEQLHYLCRREDVAPGGMRSFVVGRTRIVLCRHDERFSALRDICPHQGAALSRGVLGGTIVPSPVGHYCYGRAGEIVRCPRHGYEYDMETGRALHDPDRLRVKVYTVVERGEDVFVAIPARVHRPAAQQMVPSPVVDVAD